MGHGYTPDIAYQVTWPEYLTLIISQLPPQEETQEANDVKARMSKVRADKQAEMAR